MTSWFVLLDTDTGLYYDRVLMRCVEFSGVTQVFEPNSANTYGKNYENILVSIGHYTPTVEEVKTLLERIR